MKERLLFAMLIIASVMIVVYYKLCKLHPELISGFITIIAVAISHILNSAEDILDQIFKTPDVAPKPPATKPAPVPAAASTALPILLICALCLGLTGCASYNQKALCLQLGTTNASIPYVGGATSGSGYACYYSCIGPKCPTPDTSTITDLMTSELTASNNSIITSGPVKVTATPLK